MISSASSILALLLIFVDARTMQHGGTLHVAQRAEPKTLNPVFALDAPSREVLGRTMGDLIHINRYTQQTEPALASSWKVSASGLVYDLELRRGVSFSDGHPFSSADVLFTFEVLLDEKTACPQRELLMPGGKPIKVSAATSHKIRFELAAPYAAAERLFDSIHILPRHLLESAFRSGKLKDAWKLNTPPNLVAGLGPFRFKDYRPGEAVVIERNPHYWKAAQLQPYLSQIEFRFVPQEDMQLLRFRSGELDVLPRLSPSAYVALQSTGSVVDAGPSLEYNFLLFNLGPVDESKFSSLAARQSVYRNRAFRQALNSSVDRQSIVRLVYHSRAVALSSHVSPGNLGWRNATLPVAPFDLEAAKRLLLSAGFRYDASGVLLDASATPVETSILVSSSSPERIRMAAILQNDFEKIGIKTTIATLEFRAMIDRILNTRNFDLALMGLGGGDSDPNSEMNVWLSSGGMHLWQPSQAKAATPWEARIDQLMHEQISTLNPKRRKSLYDEVQTILAHELPILPLVSPNILIAAKPSVKGLQPARMDHYTLWNSECLFLKP